MIESDLVTRAGTFRPSRGARRLVVAVLITGYVAGWALSPFVTGYRHSDLDIFFWPSAEIAAHGHPLSIYTSQAMAQYPDANGPLGLVPLIPFAALANAMGWANSLILRVAAVYAITAVFSLLLAREAVGLIGRSPRLAGQLAVLAVFLLAPSVLISVGDFGHVEQPIELWLAFLAAGAALKGRSGLAGSAIGLAVLTRTTALLYILPIAFLLLIASGRRAATVFLAAAAVTAAVGFAPFYIADATALVHSLVSYRGDLPIGGGSLWLVANGGPLEGIIQRGDGYLIAAAATALSGAIAWRWRSTAASTADLFGALTVAAVCFPMLTKTAFSYYLFEPYVFSVVWWLARPSPLLNWRIAVPLTLTGVALLTRFTRDLLFTGTGQAVGIASSALLIAVVVLVAGDVLKSRRRRTDAPATPSRAAGLAAG